MRICLALVLLASPAAAINFAWEWNEDSFNHHSDSPVTRAQYQEFLNASAEGAVDPCGLLWNASQGITRTGVPGAYAYSGGGSAVLTHVSVIGAAQFINWLQTGQAEGDPWGPNYAAGACTYTSGIEDLWIGSYPIWPPPPGQGYYHLGWHGETSEVFNPCESNQGSPLTLHLTDTDVPFSTTQHEVFHPLFGDCFDVDGGGEFLPQSIVGHSEAGFHVFRDSIEADPGQAPHDMTDEDKALTKAIMISAAWTAAGFSAASAFCAAGLTLPLCTLPLAVMGTLSGVGSLTEKTILDVDPPDANYQQIVAVIPAPFPPMTSGRPADEMAAVNEILRSQAWRIGLGRAIITSINRASTARADGNPYWEQQQQLAIRHFLKLQGFFLTREADARALLVALLVAHGEPAMAVSAAQIADYQEELAQDGWTGAEQAMLAFMGLSSQDRLAARQHLSSQRGIPGATYPAAIDDPALRTTADGIAALLPEPASWLGLAAGVGFLAMLRNRRALWLLLPAAQIASLIAILLYEESRLASAIFYVVWIAASIGLLMMPKGACKVK